MKFEYLTHLFGLLWVLPFKKGSTGLTQGILGYWTRVQWECTLTVEIFRTVIIFAEFTMEIVNYDASLRVTLCNVTFKFRSKICPLDSLTNKQTGYSLNTGVVGLSLAPPEVRVSDAVATEPNQLPETALPQGPDSFIVTAQTEH